MEATSQKAEEIQPDKEAHSKTSNAKNDEVHSTAKVSDIVGNKVQAAKGITAPNIISLEAQIMPHAKQKNTPGESVQVPVAVLNEPVKPPTTLQVIENKTVTAPRQPKKRRNFSTKSEREYLDRVVTSWITKSDFVKDKNESMRKFSKRFVRSCHVCLIHIAILSTPTLQSSCAPQHDYACDCRETSPIE